ncbi:hypothetical protein GW17_00039620 [Ensete ventricosum]|nr:hypothetical protein GW17_00039620 [Ensete ventricosum]RZR78939.1 hypothetical protein BHM03_00004500 [Ensete ventricosum]
MHTGHLHPSAASRHVEGCRQRPPRDDGIVQGRLRKSPADIDAGLLTRGAPTVITSVCGVYLLDWSIRVNKSG